MTYDIAVIGGGIVGAATFYQIQKAFPRIGREKRHCRVRRRQF